MASNTFGDNATRTDAWWFAPEKLVLIYDKDHPLYDKRVELPVDEALARNIQAKGVLEPIIVVKEGDDRAIVVDGRQRVKAAIEANKRLVKDGLVPVRVPAVQRRGDDGSLFGVLISANEFRHGDDIIEKAKKAVRLISYGQTEAEVALTFGVSLVAVRSWLKILETDSSVRDAVRDGKLSATAAGQLATLPKDEQKKQLSELISEAASQGKKHVTSKAATRKAAGKRTKTSRALAARGTREILERFKACSGPDDPWYAPLSWVLGLEGVAAEAARKA